MGWLAAVVVGGLSGLLWADPPWWSLAVACASISVAASNRWRIAMLVLAVACASAARAASSREAHVHAPLRATLLNDGALASRPDRVSGVLTEDATLDAGGVRLTLVVDRVERQGHWVAVSGPIDLTVSGALAPPLATGWTRGRRVTATAQVRDVTLWRNPGAGPDWWQRLRRDVVAVGQVKSGALVAVGRGSAWADATASLRRAVRGAVGRTVGRFAPASAAVVTAILIGDRSALDDTTTRRLQAAGTYHVIAISGGNIAILVIAVLGVLQPWSHRPRAVALAAMAVVAVYGSVVVAAASVVRAVMAAVMVLGLSALGLRTHPWRIWLGTAAAVTLLDPLRLVDSGAWLSFGATAGLLAWAPALYARWRDARVWWRPVIALIAATVAAEAAIAPVTAMVFGQISVAGVLLNLVAIPAMAVVELAGMAAVLLAGCAPTAAVAAGWMAHAAVQVMLESARLVDLVPGLVWTTPPPPFAWVVVYYGAAFTLWWRQAPGAWPRRVPVIALTMAFTVLATAPVWPWQRPPAGRLRVTFLDVGQGDAILVELPSGRALLVDAGGASPGFDVGERVVRPALWALGRRRLDWFALTHGDLDHAGGAPRVLAAFRPREFWDGVPVVADPRWQARRRQIAVQGAVWRQVQAGDRLDDGPVRIDVWHPPRPDWERPVVRNDDSLVLRIAFGDVALALTGDAGRDVEAGWPPLGGRLRVVQAPHHGSRSSSGGAWLAAAAPHAAVISVGRGNTFGHPASEVLAGYAALGAPVFRTDRDGAVTLETDGRRLEVRTWSGRRWKATAQAMPDGRSK